MRRLFVFQVTALLSVKVANDGTEILASGRVPVTPVDSGRPTQFVRVPLVGVPRRGVTSVGEFEKTTSPLPVFVPIVISAVPFPSTGRPDVSDPEWVTVPDPLPKP
jgi:hypothetical protein